MGSDGGEKVFAHWTNITSSDKWAKLEKGMTVEYTPGEDDDGRNAAFDITLEGGEEVTCDEVEKKLSKTRHRGVVKFFIAKGFGFITNNKPITWPEKLPPDSDI